MPSFSRIIRYMFFFVLLEKKFYLWKEVQGRRGKTQENNVKCGVKGVQGTKRGPCLWMAQVRLLYPGAHHCFLLEGGEALAFVA